MRLLTDPRYICEIITHVRVSCFVSVHNEGTDCSPDFAKNRFLIALSTLPDSKSCGANATADHEQIRNIRPLFMWQGPNPWKLRVLYVAGERRNAARCVMKQLGRFL